MQVLVTFRNTEPTAALKDYATVKLQKVKKYIDEPIKAEVVLKVEKFRHVAEVTLNVNKSVLFSTAQTEDMYSAIDGVVDKVERQAQKHKTKLKKHLSANGHEKHVGHLEEAEEAAAAPADGAEE
jgi:putative sigma-54 modulation protein